jgi:hypothetical protein
VRNGEKVVNAMCMQSVFSNHRSFDAQGRRHGWCADVLADGSITNERCAMIVLCGMPVVQIAHVMLDVKKYVQVWKLAYAISRFSCSFIYAEGENGIGPLQRWMY